MILAINTRIMSLLASAIAAFLMIAPPSYADSILPATEYRDADGKSHLVNPAAAKFTIIHFWATWCAPCVEEIGQLDAFYGKYKPKGLSVIPISLDKTGVDKVQFFYKIEGIKNLPLYFDPTMRSYGQFGLRGLPSSIMVDNVGKVISVAEGPIDWESPKVIEFFEKALQ